MFFLIKCFNQSSIIINHPTIPLTLTQFSSEICAKNLKMIHDGVSSLLRSSCFFLSVFGLAMAILCYIHFFTCTNPPNPESQIQNSKNRKSKIQTPNCLIGEGKGMQRHAKAPFFIKCPNQHIYIQGFEVPQKCFQTMCCLQNASKCHPNA